jgi:hypothetical protein
MTKKITALVITISAMGAAALFAQTSANKVEGTLMLSKKAFTLKQAVAYETKIDDEDVVAVVLSGQTISSDELTAARKADKDGGTPEFKRPFLRLVFKSTGEIKNWSAASSGTSMGRHTGATTGELKRQDGRVTGKAAAASDPQDMIPFSFDVKFDAALIKGSESLPASTPVKHGPAANVKPTVSGVFKGNGKEANLAYASAHWREPFSDKTSIELVFTEKDQSKSKKPEMDAMFGKLGSALIISVHEDGSIFGCQVVHSAHQKQGFSSIGNIEMTEFTYSDGKVEGELSTNGEVDTFGEKWEVKLKFLVPLGETPKEFQVAAKPEKKEKPAEVDKDKPAAADKDDDDEDNDSAAKGPPSQSAPAGPKVKELALTKAASEVEYKVAVEHLTFKSKTDVKKVCAELAANLKTQGWMSDGPDLINPQSSILKRKQGKAKLTIFVKPDGAGSAVQMFTEGLSW